MNWEVVQNRNIFYGPGAIARFKDSLAGKRVSKALLMSYNGESKACASVIRVLQESKIPFCLNTQVRSEPDVPVIDSIAGAARAEQCDCVIALGGGSVLDAAKAVSMLLTNEGSVEEYQMNDREIINNPVPFIAIPTTSGTGSEATKVSVVYNPRNQLKKSFYHRGMIADTVILDPEVTAEMPKAITAATGIDALSHGIESYVSLNATPFTEMYSIAAIKLIVEHLMKCLRDPEDLEARGNMLLASYLAGCSLNAGIGIAHMIAQPIGGLLHIPHGDACAVFLPYAMEYNLESAVPKYCEIARCFGIASQENSLDVARRGLEKVKLFLRETGVPVNIAKYVDSSFEMEDTLNVIQGATSHITCNPKKVDRESIRKILEKSTKEG